MVLFRRFAALRFGAYIACFLFGTAVLLAGQTPSGNIEGSVSDRTGLSVANAKISIVESATQARREMISQENGRFRFIALPIGDYTLHIEASTFAPYTERSIHLSVGNTEVVRAILSAATFQETVVVNFTAENIDLATNTLGKTVTEREIVDLPLNGRNFSQLGLLQTGVAPMTAGLITQGGSMRSGQAYVVNGQRPEANNFLLDGAQNVDRMDGGFALRIPIDAVQEFRILTATASPEFGGNIGSVTSIVTKSGSSHYHGTVYEFLRNDVFDARNYFSSAVEPLKQNQFGITVGGPVINTRLFFFTY
jgi:hypothetical protein